MVRDCKTSSLVFYRSHSGSNSSFRLEIFSSGNLFAWKYRVKADRVKADRVKADRVKADRVKADRVKADRVKAHRVI
jgi:hypothetical protein